MAETTQTPDKLRAQILAGLGKRSIVFVGLMGAGKTAIGRRLAGLLALPFVDSDHEIERVSRMTVSELFARYGEPEFRALEQRVIHRLLADGPQVLATGGGAFMNDETRELIAGQGVSVWLDAELDTLMSRVSKKPTRPLLQAADPREVMRQLIETRYPVYRQARITVKSRDEPREAITQDVMTALAAYLGERSPK